MPVNIMDRPQMTALALTVVVTMKTILEIA